MLRSEYWNINRQCNAQTNTVTKATATARRQRMRCAKAKGSLDNIGCWGSTKNKGTSFLYKEVLLNDNKHDSAVNFPLFWRQKSIDAAPALSDENHYKPSRGYH
jgi:hypothetical protein